jgi:hypothetical protein
VHHLFIVLVLQAVAAIWMEELVCDTITGIGMERYSGQHLFMAKSFQ